MVYTFVWPWCQNIGLEANHLVSPGLDTKILASASVYRPNFWPRPRNTGLCIDPLASALRPNVWLHPALRPKCWPHVASIPILWPQSRPKGQSFGLDLITLVEALAKNNVMRLMPKLWHMTWGQGQNYAIKARWRQSFILEARWDQNLLSRQYWPQGQTRRSRPRPYVKRQRPKFCLEAKRKCKPC